jgi:hypothetical protein
MLWAMEAPAVRCGVVAASAVLVGRAVVAAQADAENATPLVTNDGACPSPAAPGRCLPCRSLRPDDGGRWWFGEVAEQAGVNHLFNVVGDMGAGFGDHNRFAGADADGWSRWPTVPARTRFVGRIRVGCP